MKTVARWVVRVLVILVVLAIIGLSIAFLLQWLDNRAEQAYYAERAADRPTEVVTLGAIPPELPETSGLAIGRNDPEVLWSHNDSGDDPIVYRMDRAARLTGLFTVVGARALDWESMDIGPCPPPSPIVSCLYLGDVGDNARLRPFVTVYVVPEPAAGAPSGEVELLGSLHFEYPDTAFDVEGLAITPEGGMVVVTKGRTPDITLYHLPAEALARALESDARVTLPAGIRLPIDPAWNLGRAVTGAGFDATGSFLAVRTYSEIFFFEWPIIGQPTLVAPVCLLGTTEPQGEAIAVDSDGSLLLTSESWPERAGMLLRVRCRGVPGRAGGGS